jgi:AcrR family transcriptional regulator
MPVAKGTTLDPARTRAAILDAATEILYTRGLDGIGVAELCTTIGISKETLYRHFGSKDGLVQEVLQARSDDVIRRLSDAARAAGEEPAEQLAAVFEAFHHWHAWPDFRGCGIINAATQHYTGPTRAVAGRHLDRCLRLLTDIAARAGAAEPQTLGRQLLILLEGATLLADHHQAGSAAHDAQRAAQTLLHSATTPSTLS